MLLIDYIFLIQSTMGYIVKYKKRICFMLVWV